MRKFIQRMIKEEQELRSRISKLGAFLAEPDNRELMDDDEWLLMDEQRGYMLRYQGALLKRIERAKPFE